MSEQFILTSSPFDLRKWLACGICANVCVRAISVQCCNAQACRKCATRELLNCQKCWNCQKAQKCTDLVNNYELRIAIKEFNTGTTPDHECFDFIKSKRDQQLFKVPRNQQKENLNNNKPKRGNNFRRDQVYGGIFSSSYFSPFSPYQCQKKNAKQKSHTDSIPKTCNLIGEESRFKRFAITTHPRSTPSYSHQFIGPQSSKPSTSLLSSDGSSRPDAQRNERSAQQSDGNTFVGRPNSQENTSQGIFGCVSHMAPSKQTREFTISQFATPPQFTFTKPTVIPKRGIGTILGGFQTLPKPGPLPEFAFSKPTQVSNKMWWQS
eukprot:TRINITY_DN1044_c0_g1_i3.p1 TRINITY_DN1044_c0_g1~~TRINITY_DN1044_c0_g1_i3.p1  ORF type:complete len:322 (-),score=21.51 TRINITY_DN1044_c0_g1_i3:362-1327(-)